MAQTKMTLDNFIKFLTKIRDKNNAGDYIVMNTRLDHRRHGIYEYLVNMQRGDIFVDDNNKSVEISPRINFF
jgi:hypothetical protein